MLGIKGVLTFGYASIQPPPPLFFAISRRKNAMVGFVEVSETSGSKYGMGSGVPVADTRPVVSNLAVDPLARRFGIGTALMDACEDLVKTWRFEEIILQVCIYV